MKLLVDISNYEPLITISGTLEEFALVVKCPEAETLTEVVEVLLDRWHIDQVETI